MHGLSNIYKVDKHKLSVGTMLPNAQKNIGKKQKQPKKRKKKEKKDNATKPSIPTKIAAISSNFVY
jgi:hypothetical protein